MSKKKGPVSIEGIIAKSRFNKPPENSDPPVERNSDVEKKNPYEFISSEYRKKTNKDLERNQRETRKNKEDENEAKSETREKLESELRRNQRETKDKLERNQGETKENKDSEVRRNQRETRENKEDENEAKSETREKPESKLESEPRRNQRETEEKPERKVPFSSLIGLERKITLFIFDQCQISGSRITDPITTNHLCEYCQTIVQSAKRTILTLQKKAVVIRVEYKNGRGGWTRYSLADHLFSEILQTETKEQLRRNQRETKEKLESKLESKLERTSPSVSSSLYMNQTTTTNPNPDKLNPELPQDWQDLDYSCLAPIGFKECHLRQIFDSGKANPEMVQESIYELEYDLKNGNHGMRSPLLVILKQLRSKGEPYSAINPGYVSDQVRYERKRLEELKRRDAEVKSLQEQQQEILNRGSMEQEEQEFQDWMKTKTEDEIKILAGTFNPTLPGGQAMLRNAYRAEKELVRSQVEQSLSH